MSNASNPIATPVPAASDEARRFLRFAWISVAVIPVSFVAAMALGEWLLTLQGYESGSEEPAPISGAWGLGLTVTFAVLWVLKTTITFPLPAFVMFGIGIVGVVLGVVATVRPDLSWVLIIFDGLGGRQRRRGPGHLHCQKLHHSAGRDVASGPPAPSTRLSRFASGQPGRRA